MITRKRRKDDEPSADGHGVVATPLLKVKPHISTITWFRGDLQEAVGCHYRKKSLVGRPRCKERARKAIFSFQERVFQRRPQPTFCCYRLLLSIMPPILHCIVDFQLG